MPDAATVTIPGVEIVKAGKWKASTGPVEITTDDLAAAVAASKDPEVDKGPLRFGHTGGLSNLGDSTPAFGWLDNLSIAADGETIVGDLTDVPAALAPAIKAAFKRRSAELAWGVKTVGGKAYSMVIDGLALLGVQAPAVKGLTDLAALYDPTAEPVTLATSKLSAESHSTLSFYDTPAEPTLAEKIADAVQCAKESAFRIAAVTGTLTGLQAAWDALDAMAPADSRGLPSADPHAVPVPALPKTAPGGTMPDTTLKPEDLAKARALLGLADDATDEQVTTKLAELNELVTAGIAAPVVETPAPIVETKVPAALSAETIKQLKDAGLTVVADAAFDELKRNADAGAAAHGSLAEAARENVLDLAYRQGKLGAGEAAVTLRTNLAAALERDFDGTKAVIDALPAIVPLGELGTSANTTDQLSAASAEAAFYDEVRQLFAGDIPAAQEG